MNTICWTTMTKGDGLDIEPVNILEDSGEGKGAEDDGFKRNTFGK